MTHFTNLVLAEAVIATVGEAVAAAATEAEGESICAARVEARKPAGWLSGGAGSGHPAEKEAEGGGRSGG